MSIPGGVAISVIWLSVLRLGISRLIVASAWSAAVASVTLAVAGRRRQFAAGVLLGRTGLGEATTPTRPSLPLGDGLRDADVHRRHPAAAARPRPAPAIGTAESPPPPRSPSPSRRLADRRPQRHPRVPMSSSSSPPRPPRSVLRSSSERDLIGGPCSRCWRGSPSPTSSASSACRGVWTGPRAQGGLGAAVARSMPRSVPGASGFRHSPHRPAPRQGSKLRSWALDLRRRCSCCSASGAGGQGVDQHPGRRLRGRGGRGLRR